MTSIGEITRETYGHFVWNIQNFRKLWGKYFSFSSPSFIYSRRDYYLRLGKKSDTDLYVNFNSSRIPSTNSLYVEFQLRIDRNIVSELRGRSKLSGNSGVSVDFTEFFSKESGTPLPDRLTVLLWVRELHGSDVLPDELRSDKASRKETSEKEETNSKTVNKMLKDLKSLLASGENSDVTLVVGGKEFPVHRLILCTRSPVFKAMLCHDTSERDSGNVNIDDCDPDKFQDFLTYVYTGSTRHMDTGNVISLYTTSDKYLMGELKEACVSFMKDNMSVEGFCGIATLALRHDEKELVDSLTNFFCANSKEIIETENWATFFRENPNEAYEHFIKPSIRGR